MNSICENLCESVASPGLPFGFGSKGGKGRDAPSFPCAFPVRLSLGGGGCPSRLCVYLDPIPKNQTPSHPVAVSRTDFETFFRGARPSRSLCGASRAALPGKLVIGETPNIARERHALLINALTRMACKISGAGPVKVSQSGSNRYDVEKRLKWAIRGNV